MKRCLGSQTVFSKDTAMALPVRAIVIEILEDPVFVENPIIVSLSKALKHTTLHTFMVDLIEAWLQDTLIKPLEDIVSGNKTPNSAEAMLDDIYELHEANMETYEFLLSHRAIKIYKDTIEEFADSAYDLWSIEQTKRFTYVTYTGDFRVKYFDTVVKQSSINDYVKIKELL